MREWLPWIDDADDGGPCRCDVSATDRGLVVDANGCPGGGDLAESADCRATVIDALVGVDASPIFVRRAGSERAYIDEAATLLVAAGRFVARAAIFDRRLADLARRDPLGAVADATARAGPLAEVAESSALASLEPEVAGYDDVLRPAVGPTVSDAWFWLRPPGEARLVDRRTLDTGAVVRRFETSGDSLPTYHLTPLGCRLEEEPLAALEAAHALLPTGAVTGVNAAYRAVERVATGDLPREAIARVLHKHTADLGVLVDCFTDPAVTDVFASAPIPETPLRVRVDGALAETNVRLSARGARALASRLRLESGRSFSRASPTLDAATMAGDRRVRVGATCEPVSDGFSYTFRAHDRTPWTVDRLVENGTVTPAAAALLSTTVERAGAVLVAGTRGAGKTTLLGSLLFELPRSVRTLVIEDTPELPVEALQQRGRDVQSLLTQSGEGPGLAAEEALRTALRMGEGALVIGEVRGEEAAVLYEAMRVGASGSAVLGTIHGDGPRAVRERVVEDLGVPESSFATTDLVVSLAPIVEGGERSRRVVSVDEVIGGDDGVRFATLFEYSEDGLVPTGRIDRGNSHLVERLICPDETYSDVRALLDARRDWFDAFVPPGEYASEVTPAWAT